MYNNNHGMKISMTKKAICIEIYKNHNIYEPFINLKNIGATCESISQCSESTPSTAPSPVIELPEKKEHTYYAPKSRWVSLMFIAQNTPYFCVKRSQNAGMHIITPTELLILSNTLPPYLTREISDYIRSLKYNLVTYGSPIFTGTSQSELFGSVVAQYLGLNIGDYINVDGTSDNILWNGSKFSVEQQSEKIT